ncbi:beta-galactosidase [Pseudalgibacter alginicilyticus]|uniref:Beta-glucosidase n=1 Tax=Pseudalgibacter alginicilyticus TaxID=1736674 RepID=A0A0P0D6B0_9FLAO|nr:GH1 family beta-glucosidase [Pseudalgibacter alginicilyticus]ALJ05648.1 beta-galactosidase [Pseudalgibacter alginicilyticus]
MTKKTKQSTFKLKARDFGNNFVWGVSTAAYQIEGAHNIDGKGVSIWDVFTTKKGAIQQNENANTAVDFYHKYKEDILLMKSMNIPNFRFSLSWSRLIPNGEGEINLEGINFYNRVIDFCLECNITPWITLYHWDLPQALEEKGGWTNRDILEWFENYASLCAKQFGDRVKHWMVLNEPMVFTGAGYFLGVHAPGQKRLKKFLPAIHHAVLCQALGGRILRNLIPNSVIGTTFSCSEVTPYRNTKKDIFAVKKADALLNRLFIEPVLGLGYPTEKVPVLKQIKTYVHPNDMENAKFEFDFIGVQNYTREVIKHSYYVPYIYSKIVKASNRNVKTTLMDWEVYPPSIYNMIKQFNQYKSIKKIIITENGAAFNDILQNGEIHDVDRLNYFQTYLQQVYKAKQDGLNVEGYFAWTFTDNFEWAEGYRPRFGLVYVDFSTQKRFIKASGKWFKKFLKTLNN